MQIAFTKDKNNIIKKNKIIETLKHVFRLDGLLCYFLFLVLLGFIFFITSLSWNSFTTPFTGDYCAQQISFYTHGYDTWWTFFTTGNFPLYDTSTFLGASNVGANSFYYLFDPFFFPILLCPRTYIAQGMAVLTILKIALAGLFFYFYLTYLGASNRASKVSGIAYAFCGWMGWYLWFNHMTEIVTVFPLVLLGVEKILKEKKPWMLIFSFALVSFTNYYFAVTIIICAFIYAAWRYFQRIKLNSAKENLQILGIGFLGFLCGCLSGCIILLPTCLYALNTSRGVGTYLGDLQSSLSSGDFGHFFSLIFDWGQVDYYYKNEYRSMYAVIEYIFPPVTNRNIPTITINGDSYEPEACSLFCYIPIMLLFIPAQIKSIREKKFSHVVATLVFILALSTPFTYYLMHGFSQPYSRWTIFPTICLIAYVGLYLDKVNEEPKWMILIGGASLFAILLLGSLFTYLILQGNNESRGYTFNSRVPFGLFFGLEAGYIVLVTIVLYLIFRFSRKHLFLAMTGFISIEVALVGGFIIEGQGVGTYQQVNNGWYNNEVLSQQVKSVKKDDPTYYRSYSSLATTSAENDGMRNNYNGLSFFHSLYNFNVDDFCSWSSIKGYSSWSGCYNEKRENMDLFLGVKYYYVEKRLVKLMDQPGFTIKNYHANVPVGCIDVSDKYPNDAFYVYENTLHNDFAFTFDSYYLATESQTEGRYNFNGYNSVGREEVYLSSAILYPEDEDYVLSVNNELKPMGTSHGIEAKSIYDRLVYSYYDILNRKNQDKVTWGYGLSPEELLSINPDNDEFPLITNKPDDDKSHHGRYVEVLTTKSYSSFPYDEDGYSFYMYAPFDEDYQHSEIDVYFVDDNNKFILFDDHGDGRCGNKGGEYRCYHVSPTYNSNNESNHDAPHVDRIIICPRHQSAYTPYTIYYDSITNVKNRLAKNEPLSNIKYSTDTFTFSSNFDKPRIVVTQIPYEDGWSLTVNQNNETKNMKVLKLQGGFVGFMSVAGEADYKLSFYTPYLNIGTFISIVGIIGFFSSLIAYTYISTNNKYLSAFKEY